MSRNNIIEEELRSENPILAGIVSKSVYTIPFGYFEDIADSVLRKINAGLEPGYAFTNHILYTLPVNYFQDLPSIILQKIKKPQAAIDSVVNELDTIAPLLNTIGKHQVYSIPQGYFENPPSIANQAQQKQGKLVRFHFHKIYKLAAAAVITGILALGAYLFTEKEKTAQQAVIETSKIEVKNLSETDIVEFLADPAVATFSGVLPATEIRNAVKEIPDDEIKQFLQDNDVPEGI